MVGKYICTPDGVTATQKKDIVVRYLQVHPEERHYNAASTVWAAFKVAFPCAKK